MHDVLAVVAAPHTGRGARGVYREKKKCAYFLSVVVPGETVSCQWKGSHWVEKPGIFLVGKGGGGGGDSEGGGATVFLCAPCSAGGAGATGGEGRDGNVLFSEEEQIGLRCRRF